MQCPVCKTRKQHIEMNMHVNGFDESIISCDLCGTTWSVNHGTVEIVNDAQVASFLQAQTECVEADDYNYVGA